MAEGSRWMRAWPALGMVLWSAGAAGLAYASRAGHWSAGVTVLAGSSWLVVLLLASREPLRNLFGPVFTYEILRLGRKRLTFVLRFLYVLVIVGLLALLYATWMASKSRYGYTGTVRPAELASFANSFFEAFASIQFAVALFLTPAYVAGCISDEKERQTLEFLLATDLRNREIIFGKLAARITNLLMYVLAGLPVVAFLQLFGGIDPELALSAAASTAITVLGLSALSILCSTLVKKSRDAMAIAYSLLFLYIAVSGLAGLLGIALVRRFGTLFTIGGTAFVAGDFIDRFASGNLIYTVLVRTSGGKNMDDDIIAGILREYAIFWGIGAILMIGFAVLRLRTVALAQSHGEAKSRKKGSSRMRAQLGTDPILWREVFTGHRRAGFVAWFFRFTVVLLLTVIPVVAAYQSFFIPRPWRVTFADQWEDFVRVMSVWVRVATGFLAMLIFFGAALRGAASISGEKDRDTWISLIASPLTPWEVLRGKFLGAVLGMRFFYGTILAVWAVGLALGSTHILSLPFAIVHLALYTSAFALLGMLCSATARTTLIASIRAFGAAFFFAGGFWLMLLLCCVLPMSFTVNSTGRSYDMSGQFMLAFTPTFMTGFWPMRSAHQDDLGPFAMTGSYNVGPIAPFVGFWVWVGFTALLVAMAYRQIAVAMNRTPAIYRQAPRPSRKRGK